jgi:hypothetical protein
MEPKHYTIRTVQDFLNVPEDRRALCLSEFGIWLEHVEAMKPLVDMIPDGMLKNDPFAAFNWIDDDKGECTISVSEASTGKNLMRVVLPLPKGEA